VADAALHYIVLSDTLINAYHTKIAPQMLMNPTRNLEIICSLKAFIDDIVLHATSHRQDPIDDLQTCAQTQLQQWAQLVQVMGGKLNPKKCCGLVYQCKPNKQGILLWYNLNYPLTTFC